MSVMLAAVLSVLLALPVVLKDSEDGSHGCTVQAKPVKIDLQQKHQPLLDHIADAIADGHPEFLILARNQAYENRKDALRGYDKVPEKHLDEYPPASTDEGGEGASVRPIDPSINQSAGSKMGHQLSGYCNGQVFHFEQRWDEVR
jgi:hypothetical protein